MTFFIYGDSTPGDRGASNVPYEKWRANDHWATHTYNMVVLNHIAAETRDAREKLQAENEILIAERKRTFWKRHPNFDAAIAANVFRNQFKMEVPT